MITVDEALELISHHVVALSEERIPLAEAHGRVLAKPLHARSDAPRWPVSAMDGYAVIAAGTSPDEALEVIGQSHAGRSFDGTLLPGQAVRIFTGARLPSRADMVILQEYASCDGNEVRFTQGYGPASHVRADGSDFRAGDELIPKGTMLDARAMVVAAAADVTHVVVARRPQIALFATGDELAVPGSAYRVPDAIPESVSFGIAAMVEESGGNLVSRRSGADDLAALTKAAGEALDGADLVIVTGGASVGERDFAKQMFAPHGLALLFDKVAMKPGKPVWLGKAQDSLVLGLPGNPTSAMVTAALFLRPILAQLQGGSGAHRWHQLPLAKELKATGSRETFVRARWDEAGLTVLDNQGSGVQAALLQADRLIRCPADSAALSVGDSVTALAF
ncbi:molybdopterin molybdotransferase MoeA [Erythrobacter mangrovi]|uniref:molybdopterin molybdotransferase MoeA n=1 Tax=Erythrobacter mangrovi TaxID=2739433 RepID=UPI0018F8C3E2|nr:molybdopterin molybdotransferase MoeA [Erythrobacter mangrovi]